MRTLKGGAKRNRGRIDRELSRAQKEGPLRIKDASVWGFEISTLKKTRGTKTFPRISIKRWGDRTVKERVLSNLGS